MTSLPFFSIIIPTYNSAKTLSAALESILQQDFPDCEILIIDGCSKDNTLQIAKEYNDARIKIVSEPDNGIYDAMNKGVALAKGEWLYFLGSDDQLYANDVLGKVASVCSPALDVVYGNVYSTRFGGLYDGVFDEGKILKRNICHQAIFIKKSLFASIGSFNTQYMAHADWDHNLRWFLSPHTKHHFIDVVIANYADGGLSSTSPDVAFKKDKILNYLRYSKNTLAFNKKLHLIKRELISHLKKRNTKLVFRLLHHIPGILLSHSR